MVLVMNNTWCSSQLGNSKALRRSMPGTRDTTYIVPIIPHTWQCFLRQVLVTLNWSQSTDMIVSLLMEGVLRTLRDFLPFSCLTDHIPLSALTHNIFVVMRHFYMVITSHMWLLSTRHVVSVMQCYYLLWWLLYLILIRLVCWASMDVVVLCKALQHRPQEVTDDFEGRRQLLLSQEKPSAPNFLPLCLEL